MGSTWAGGEKYAFRKQYMSLGNFITKRSYVVQGRAYYDGALSDPAPVEKRSSLDATEW